MIEIPEAITLAKQIDSNLIGKVIKNVYVANSPHKFCFYNGEPEKYDNMLKGKILNFAQGHGMFVDIHFEDVTLTVNDGVNIRYFDSPLLKPQKYQLLIEFTDYSCLVFTVAMYGGIYAFKGDFDNPYYQGSLRSISPLTDNFEEKYFKSLLDGSGNNLSAKAFLATKQRIVGLGNGCLQDILLSAGINPKRKMSSVSKYEFGEMFYAVKAVLNDMTAKGGRDTEKDIFGNYGRYKTMLSKSSKNCVLCGSHIIKESYLGGSIYYCPQCQSLDVNC